jgi:undecaprenyl-phosphate 4-deoxy-4-formamido-L-arabinose transferase
VVSVAGVIIALIGVVTAIVLMINRIAGGDLPAGWSSLMVTTLVLSGITLFFVGVVAEYVGVAVNQAMGKPPYLIVSDPADGPLGRDNQGDGSAGMTST